MNIDNRVPYRAGTDLIYSDYMDRLFERRRSELAKSHLSARSDHNLAAIEGSGKDERRHESKSAKPSSHRHKSSNGVVDELLNRVSLTGNSLPQVQTQKPKLNNPSKEDGISELLHRLKPQHNDHLRRSSRAISGSKRPQTDLVDSEDDIPIDNKYSKIHGLGDPWKKPLTYPKIGKKKTTVEFADLERLDEGEFLNDNLISFYLRYLEHNLEEQRPDVSKRVYFFNTFFFATLTNTHKGKKGFNYDGVQKWTRNVDLFTYDYIVVPINESTHWYLAIICNLPVLDRNLDFLNDRSSSPAEPVPISNEPREGSLPSSQTAQVSGNDLNPSLDEVGERDEREARNSFAELSLAHDVHEEPAIEETRMEQVDPEGKIWTEDDQEMLDVQSNGQTPFAQSTILQGIENSATASGIHKDNVEVPKPTSKNKKAKRKSMPPITKVDPTKPAIVTFDSLGMSRSPTIKILKDYLREEAKGKRGGMEFDAAQIKGITASMIPQQENFYDCGVFLLGYVAKFLEKDPKDFIASIIGRKYDVERDWPNLKPDKLRANIREQVVKLHDDQEADRQKERSAQKAGKDSVKVARTAESSPTQKSKGFKSATQEQPRSLDITKQAQNGTSASGQPHSRKEALENASSIEPRVDDDVNNDFGNRGQGHSMRVIQGERAKPATAPKQEPSIITVDSQSQQDSSTLLNDIHSYISEPKGAITADPPELPVEIQDSQPSQPPVSKSSKLFSDILAQEKEEQEIASADNEAEEADIPIVRLEAQGNSKRKQPVKESTPPAKQTVVTKVEVSSPKSDQNSTQFTVGEDQGKQRPTKRRKAERKVMKQEEVISIDDD